MKKGFISTYTDNDWGLTSPMIYYVGQWLVATPWVYTGGQWRKAGAAGTNMVYWLDSDRNYMVDSNGDYILIRSN